MLLPLVGSLELGWWDVADGFEVLAAFAAVMHESGEALPALPDSHLQASRARSVRSDVEVCQPTMNRLESSMMRAT